MQGQGSASSPLSEALEFEGRFMSSCPITNNPFWWHHEQNPLEQQMPDFILVPNDTGASHQSLVGQMGCNSERLNLGQSNSRTMKNGSGYSEQTEFERASSANAFTVSSGSNNLPYQPTMGTYGDGSSIQVSNHNLNRPLVVGNSLNDVILSGFLPNSEAPGHVNNEHIASASSSSYPSMNMSSEKRKSPEQSSDESSAVASKRSLQISGSSGLHVASSSHASGGGLNMSSPSANIFSLGSLGILSTGTVPPPRSLVFDSPLISRTARSYQNVQQNFLSRANNFVQDSVPANLSLSGTVIRNDINRSVQRPLLVLPPPQAVREGSTVHVQSHPPSVHCPAILQPRATFGNHQNGSSNIPSNSSDSVFMMGASQIDGMRLSNSTQGLQLPVITPTAGSRNSVWNAVNTRTSGGAAINPVNAVLRPPSDLSPSVPVPHPNLVSNSYRRRRLEQIRQALLDIDSLLGASTINHPGVHMALPPEVRQRFLSQARHMIAMYRGGSDIPPLENGADVRQSMLSALASVQDQHRDMRLDVDNMSYEELLELGERIGHVKTGLSEETILNSLKHTKYAFIMKSNKPDAEPCSICREEYVEGEDLGTLDCGHDYHTSCIKQWLVLKNACPICKAAAASDSK